MNRSAVTPSTSLEGSTTNPIPKRWREQAKNSEQPTTPNGERLPQGIVVGCTGNITAMVNTRDVHVLMIGAAGVGKTAFWLYPYTVADNGSRAVQYAEKKEIMDGIIQKYHPD